MYIAIRCSDFVVFNGTYRAYGYPVAVGNNLDDLKHACYLDLVAVFLREQLPDMATAGMKEWRTLRDNDLDCHFIKDTFGHVHYAIHPIAIAIAQETRNHE